MEISNVLYKIGAALRKEDPFRSRAYFKAAKNVEGIELDKLSDEEILAIPGVGKSIFKVIKDLLSGNTSKLKEVNIEYLPDFELVKLRGIGYAKAAEIYHKYKISTIDDLPKKIPLIREDNPRLADLLTVSLGFYRGAKDKVPLVHALGYARVIQSFLQDVVITIKPAGSLRRYESLVRDLDFVVIPKSYSSFLAKVQELLVIESCGKYKITGTLKTAMLPNVSIHVDFTLTHRSTFGNTLNYLTGSKDFNISLRSLAKQRGLTVNEYKTIVVKSGKELPASTERDLFDNIGVSYVPPHIRKDGSEIDNLKGVVKTKHLKADYHLHSSEFSSDAFYSISKLVKAAKDLGYVEIGIADHSKPAASSYITNLKEYAKYVRSFSSKRLTVLAGIELELDITGNNKYYSWSELKKLDYVVVACHVAPDKNVEDRIINAVHNLYPTPVILAHISNRLLNQRAGAQLDLSKLRKIFKYDNVILEINSHPMRLDPDVSIIRKLKNVPFVVSSDAHSIIGMNLNFEFGIKHAQAGLAKAKNLVILSDRL